MHSGDGTGDAASARKVAGQGIRRAMDTSGHAMKAGWRQTEVLGVSSYVGLSASIATHSVSSVSLSLLRSNGQSYDHNKSLLSLTGRRVLPVALLSLLLPLAALRGFAADAPANPDILVFTNGDQLTGKLISSAGGSVVFHSDMAGDVTVDWAKIKEIRTPQKFAVIENGVKPNRKNPEAVPQGTVTIADQSVQVHPDSGAPLAPIPVKNINFLIDDPTFQSKIKTEPGFFHAWHGNATGGATIVQRRRIHIPLMGRSRWPASSPT